MDSESQGSIDNIIVEINDQHRWAIYHRLQELDIPCDCSVYQPLIVRVDTPEIAIQLRSVVRQFTQSRRQLVQGLDKSWQLHSYTP